MRGVDSKGNPGIGLADIVAGVLSRYLNTGEITGFLKLISLILVPWRGVALVKPVPTRTFYTFQ